MTRSALPGAVLSAPGSRLAFEHDPASALIEGARDMPAMRRYAAMWKGGLGVEAPEWLAEHGRRPRTHEMAAVAASYGRPEAEASGGFLTADRT